MAKITGSFSAFADSLDLTASQSESVMASLEYLFDMQDTINSASAVALAGISSAGTTGVATRTRADWAYDVVADATATPPITADDEVHTLITWYGSTNQKSDLRTDRYSIKKIVTETEYDSHTGFKEILSGYLSHSNAVTRGTITQKNYVDGSEGTLLTLNGKYEYFEGVETSQMTNSFVYEDGTTKLSVTGDLRYEQATGTLSGTISKISAYKNGALVFSADDLKLDAASLQTEDVSTLTAQALSTGSSTVDSSADTADTEIISGDGNDAIKAGSGDDTIAAGSGNDKMTGGQGADIFVFDTSLNARTNVDTITDFEAGNDLLDLNSNVFTNLTFVSVYKLSSATDGEGVIYESSSGKLYYDDDGAGTGAGAILFARLTGKPDFSDSDFISS